MPSQQAPRPMLVASSTSASPMKPSSSIGVPFLATMTAYTSVPFTMLRRPGPLNMRTVMPCQLSLRHSTPRRSSCALSGAPVYLRTELRR